MSNDKIFKKRREERRKRIQNIEKQKSNHWLIVCEGIQTEPNYFKEAVEFINKDIVGTGRNTTSLVNKTAEYLQNEIDKNNNKKLVPYGKIFVVFDKDSFKNNEFDCAIEMCKRNGYIPLWSNQAIEYWFLLHFNLVEGNMDRNIYESKLNEYFKKSGLKYKYKKNDKNIYSKLTKYGSEINAIRNAKKIHSSFECVSPSKKESCTTVYKFFDEVQERLEELK